MNRDPKNNLRLLLPFFGLVIFITSCSTKIALGTYHSRFATNDFFTTTIRLKAENKLEYIFQGDLIYDSVTGHYKILGNKLFITFDKEPFDSLRTYYDEMELKTKVIKGDTIHYKMFCYLGHNKLFPGHLVTEKKVTRAIGYWTRKKYILFGSHYYNKRYYYRRIV